MPPATLQALTVLVLGIAPGFVGIRGYSRRRYRTVPDRDLYALAASAVISAIWIGVIWLLLLEVGNPIERWGLVPYREALLRAHQIDVVLLMLAIVCIPYPLGSLSAILMDTLEGLSKSSPSLWKLMRKTGFFKPPTAWDRAWLKFAREQGAGEIFVQMEDGLIVRGGFGRRSRVDLSPNSPQLFLEDGYGYRLDDDGAPVEVEAYGGAGVYLPGDRIGAIYFLPPELVSSHSQAGAKPAPAKAADE